MLYNTVRNLNKFLRFSGPGAPKARSNGTYDTPIESYGSWLQFGAKKFHPPFFYNPPGAVIWTELEISSNSRVPKRGYVQITKAPKIFELGS